MSDFKVVGLDRYLAKISEKNNDTYTWDVSMLGASGFQLNIKNSTGKKVGGGPMKPYGREADSYAVDFNKKKIRVVFTFFM